MWHYLIPSLGAIPCFAVWSYVGHNHSYGNIDPIALYGLAFLGNLVSIAQPAALAYRTSTLYGAAEQAVGGASAVAALSIASIIGPQVGFASSPPILCQIDEDFRYTHHQMPLGMFQGLVPRAQRWPSPVLAMLPSRSGFCGKPSRGRRRLAMQCRFARSKTPYMLR